jgi:hypothetical protein
MLTASFGLTAAAALLEQLLPSKNL